MDFSGNNKTGNTTALTDKIMQKIPIKIYTAIFWLQLALNLNYIFTNNSLPSHLSILIFFNGRKSAWNQFQFLQGNWNLVSLTHGLLDIISISCVPIPFKSSHSTENLFSPVITNYSWNSGSFAISVDCREVGSGQSMQTLLPPC